MKKTALVSNRVQESTNPDLSPVSGSAAQTLPLSPPDRTSDSPFSIDVDLAVKVRDNYGDAGVALRFLRALAGFEGIRRVRLFIDRPAILETLLAGGWAFCGPGTELLLRETDGVTEKTMGLMVYDWTGMPPRGEDPPNLLVEMFGGGLPEGYIPGIFPETTPSGQKSLKGQKSLMLNLEYLTAETWAEDYHLVPSSSPHPGLERFFFMPGFSRGTGGLIRNASFVALKRIWDGYDVPARSRARRALFNKWKLDLPRGREDDLWISIFSYGKDFRGLIDQMDTGDGITFLLSPGGAAGDFSAFSGSLEKPVSCLKLPFLEQEEWDSLILACDINLVRGEESLSRAALSGRPFLWQAYPLKNGGHLDKVKALCGLLCRGRMDLRELFMVYNTEPEEMSGDRAPEYSMLWKDVGSLRSLYREFTAELENNGDCVGNVIEFYRKFLELSA